MRARSTRPSLLAGLVALAGVLGVLGAACGGGPSDQADPEQRRADQPAATDPGAASAPSRPPSPPTTPPTTLTGTDRAARPAPIPAVLDFAAPALGGGTVRGAEYAGSGVALWFWAPW